LSQFHEGDASWPVELIGHHASVPLAFAILYQDFPFALADLFLKRALTLLALVIPPFAALATLRGMPVGGTGTFRDVRDISILVTLWVSTALLYPALRGAAEWFVDTIILDRPDYDALRSEIGQSIQQHQDVESVLDDACERLAPSLNARVVRWHEVTVEGAVRAAARVDIPVVEPPQYVISPADAGCCPTIMRHSRRSPRCWDTASMRFG
jgi:hypothetical protein